MRHDTTIDEYQVFTDEREAFDCAFDQAELSGRDWMVYPLYPANGIDAA